MRFCSVAKFAESCGVAGGAATVVLLVLMSVLLLVSMSVLLLVVI